MYAILLWFASDNIMGYVASPILFYPLVLIGSILFVVWQLELLPILIEQGVPEATRRVNRLLAKTPIDFRL